MHEITLCQNALEIMQQQANRHGARRITAVWLEIGAFSCVELDALTFCFELVCRNTLAEGCELHIEQQSAESWCHDCQQAITLLSSRVVQCPKCSSRNVRLIADEGMQIHRLEVE